MMNAVPGSVVCAGRCSEGVAKDYVVDLAHWAFAAGREMRVVGVWDSVFQFKQRDTRTGVRCLWKSFDSRVVGLPHTT